MRFGRVRTSCLPLGRLVGGSLCALLSIAAFDSIAGAATYTPADGPALTTVLNSASLAPGDTIILIAGNTYTAPVGGFILKERGTQSDTAYITIQSSALASLPPAGERIKPIHAANMPKIRTASLTNERTIRTATTGTPQPVPHHYQLIGLEIIGPANNAANIHGLIEIGVNASTQNADNLVPHHFIIDRCYIHDNSSTQTVQLGISLHGKNVDIINSHISGIKHGGAEAKAIHGANGPGPFNITNNYLEAAAMSIFFGGVQNYITGMTPSNILVNRNHMYKPESWKTDPGNWWVKNIFELKCGVNVTIDSNILDNCWLDAGAQYGAAIVLKTVQNSGGSPWYTTQNVTITNNIVRNVGQGVVIAGSRNPLNQDLFGLPDTVTIRNNLFANVTGTNLVAGNRGWLFQFGSGSPNVTIDHNTGFQSGGGAPGTSTADRIIEAGDGGVDHPNFVFKNNLLQHVNGGIRGSGFSDGEGVLGAYFPGCTYQKNVLMGATLANYDPNYLGGWSPSSLAFPTSWTGVLVNFASPGSNYAGYKVVTGSSWAGAGTDSKDIGCNIDEVNTATAGCISGVWGAPPPTGTLIEDFANSTDYWGGAYTGLTADDVITGGKLIFVANGSGAALIVSSEHKHNGENVSSASVWTTGDDFSGQGNTKLTFTLKNTGATALTASNFPGVQDYFSISCKKNSTAGNLASNRANWNLSTILFANQSSIAAGETITVSVPFATPNSWLTSGIANQYGMDPANDRYIFAGFRFSVGSGNGTKNLEIDDIRIQP